MRTIEPEYRELTDVINDTITITKASYRELADAIILQAVDDYRKALDGKSYSQHVNKTPEWVKKECKKFFRSSWFRALTKIDGDFLIEQLEREHNEKVRRKQSCKLK
jgi:hypothetical protein